MQHKAWISVACLVGGLMVLALWLGLDGEAQAAVMDPSADPRDVVINEVAWGGHRG